jgi:hypothetical protein
MHRPPGLGRQGGIDPTASLSFEFRNEPMLNPLKCDDRCLNGTFIESVVHGFLALQPCKLELLCEGIATNNNIM